MVWEGEAMPAPPDANKAVFFGMQAVDGLDQFIKVENINDETLVSFSFTDSPLPFVLGPLADFTGRPHLPSMGVAAGRPVAVVRTIEQATGGIESVQGDIVQAHVVEGGPVHMAVRHIGPAEPAELPHSPFLVIEDDSARERHVTVAGENMTIAAALDKIGEAANCNIFQQGNNVVVDWCGAQ